MSRLLIFATHVEAEDSIRTLRAKLSEPGHYLFDGGALVISGMGCYAAMHCAFKHAHKYDKIINAGICGALHDRVQIGTLYKTSCVSKYTPLPLSLDEVSRAIAEGHLPHFTLEGTHRLISSDFPIHDATLRDTLGTNWDLVDMEGYGVVYAARGMKKEVELWKVVSDFAQQGGRMLIKKHLSASSKLISNLL
jgi:nucleoside phosphorylase